MGVVVTNSSPSSLSSSLLASVTLSTKPLANCPVPRLQWKSTHQLSKSLSGLCFNIPVVIMRSGVMSIKALNEIKGTGPDGGDSSVSESDDDEHLLFDKLPLDSKLQQKLEQKMRMKLGKKIRLRRKKLVRKRRMRKKGQ